MEKILFLNLSPASKVILSELQSHYEVLHCQTLKEMLIKLLDHPDVSIVIIDTEPNTMALRQFIKKIHILNPILPIVIIKKKTGEEDEAAWQSEGQIITHIETTDGLLNIVAATMVNRRKFNRIEWPLKVKFFFASNLDESFPGQVFSFSIGGAYVQTEKADLVTGQKSLFMNVSFKDFNFLVEGVIIRVNKVNTPSLPKGFSVQFVNVSPATQGAINNIINDRIILELFSDVQEVDMEEVPEK